MERGMKTITSVTSKDGTTIAYDRSGVGPVLTPAGGAFQFRGGRATGGLTVEALHGVPYDRHGRVKNPTVLAGQKCGPIHICEAAIQEVRAGVAASRRSVR